MQTDDTVASHMPKKVEDLFGMSSRATNSEESEITILLKIVTFVTKNSEAEKLDLRMGLSLR